MSAVECTRLMSVVVMTVDYSSGFGGKYGVQKDRQDQSALGFDHQEKLEKHASQKGTEKHNYNMT